MTRGTKNSSRPTTSSGSTSPNTAGNCSPCAGSVQALPFGDRRPGGRASVHGQESDRGQRARGQKSLVEGFVALDGAAQGEVALDEAPLALPDPSGQRAIFEKADECLAQGVGI